MLWLLRRPWFRFSHFKGKEEIHFPTCYLRSQGAPQSLDIHLLNYVEILSLIYYYFLFFTASRYSRQSISIYVAVARLFNNWGGAQRWSWCLFELAGLFGGNDYELSFGSRLRQRTGVGGREGRASHCAKQADGWPDTVLIMATLVCWEATLCSRSMAAEEWRIVMTRSPCPGTRSSFKDVAISNVCSVIRVPLSPSLDFQKFIGVAEAVIMAY